MDKLSINLTHVHRYVVGIRPRLKVLLSLLCVLFSNVVPGPRAFFLQDSLQTESSPTRQNQIIIDLGVFAPGSDAAGGWRATFALRAGIGRRINEVFTITGFLDYYQHSLPPAAGNSHYLPESGKRHDIAIYANVTMYNFLHVGAGTYYTTSNAVSLVSLSDPTPRPWQDSGFSEFRFFFTAGVEYRIRISDNFFLPIGLYGRSNYAMNNTLPLYLRLGAALTF